MQRNCVDVVKRSLKIEKSADREKINTDNVATFTIKFENSSDAGWIDGGRPRVNVSYACENQETNYFSNSDCSTMQLSLISTMATTGFLITFTMLA